MAEAPQNYQVLARRYRPTKFSELMGQEVLVKTLTNAIEAGRVAHAFIFTGVRGVGKTTTARLLARALNCEGHGDKPTIDPCGTCPQCVAIAEDRHVDVMEVDAASRTGVDDVRELIDGVHYKPAMGRYKVYIIDEVHMLSKSAFNALLKTLEEPPAHVKFIFATTEIRKVPITVLSRCQRFDLQLIDADTLFPYFSDILNKEGVTFDENALRLICKAADGSARDGKSLLEQALVGSPDKNITEAFVKDMLGMGDKTMIVDLLETLLKGETTEALKEARRLVKKGASVQQILVDLMEIVHALSIMKVTKSDQDQHMTIPSESLKKCANMVQTLTIPTLNRCWQVLLKGQQELTLSPLPECALDMILIRLMHAQSLLSEGSTPKPKPVPVETTESTQTMTQSTAKESLPKNYEALVALFEHHKEFILADNLKRHASLQSFTTGHVVVGVPADHDKTFLRDAGQKLKDWTGKPWVLEASSTPGGDNLHEKEKAQKQQEEEAMMARPDVRKVLETFPEAKVTPV